MVMVTAAASAVDLQNLDVSYAPLRTATHSPSAPVPGAVVSIDGRTGAPTFIWADPQTASLARAGNSAETVARRALATFAPAYGLSTHALETVVAERVLDTGRGGILVVLTQQVDEVPVYGQRLAVLLTRDLRPVALGGSLHPSAVRGLGSRAPLALDEAGALAVAFKDLHGISLDVSEFRATGNADPFGRRFELAATGRARSDGFVLTAPARAGRTWFPLGDELIAAYQVELLVGHDNSTDADAYSWVIAADDGRLLRRQNLTESDSFNYRVWADPTAALTPIDGPHADFTPHPTGTPDGL